MHWKRLAHAFLLGTGFCVLGAGCAAVNALVSSPAGSGANSNSPQRLAAIGRVFENQGRLTQAQAMYRQALKVQPGNSIAKQRLQYIASLNSKNRKPTIQQQTKSAIAVADSLAPTKKSRVFEAGEAPSSETQVVVHKEEPVEVPELPALDEQVAEPLILSAAKAPSTSDEDNGEFDEPATVEVALEDSTTSEIDSGVELAALAEADPAPTGLNFAPAFKSEDKTIETVGFGPEDSGWTTTQRVVTLDQVLACSEAPQDFENELLDGLRLGEDDGVKALAATLLSEVAENEQVNETLRASIQAGSPIVQITAFESLTGRNALTEDEVQVVLDLARGDDAELRIQAASSLRRLAGTQWAGECVAGLAGMLSDTNPSVIAMAATTLGDFGEAATDVREQLQQIGTDTVDQFVADAVANSLSRIPQPVVTAEGEYLPAASDEGADETFLPVVE